MQNRWAVLHINLLHYALCAFHVSGRAMSNLVDQVHVHFDQPVGYTPQLQIWTDHGESFVMNATQDAHPIVFDAKPLRQNQ